MNRLDENVNEEVLIFLIFSGTKMLNYKVFY